MQVSRRAWLLVLSFFFLSGFAALVYEVVWQRMLHLVFGESALATATVLAAFMAGLALGSFYFGRKVDSSKRPLKLYAILEIGIGVFALIFPFIITAITALYVAIAQQFSTTFWIMSLLKFLICFAVLLIPAALMGGTLPVMSKFVIRRLDRVGPAIGWLYGINTLGAVAGCMAAGYYLILALGVQGASMLGAAVNILIGLLAFVLDARTPEMTPGAVQEPDADSQPETSASSAPFPPRLDTLVLAVAALSGFCALAYEVLWSRTLIFFLDNNVYAFPTMLTTFLLGSAVGSLIVTRLFGRQKYLFTTLGILQILIGLASLVTMWQFTILDDLTGSVEAAAGSHFLSSMMGGLAVSFEIMFLPALIMGMIIPLASRLCTRSVGRLGRSIGAVYSANTVGATVGSFAAGFAIIPFIGITRGITIIALLNFVVGVLVLTLSPEIKDRTRWSLTGTATVASILFVFVIVPWGEPLWLHSPTFRKLRIGERVLFYEEGLGATVSVRQFAPRPYDNSRGTLIEVNGVNVAGTTPKLRISQKMQGHLPLILYKATTGRDAKNAFILGLGSGESSRSICLHDIEKLDCVELASAEIRANPYFHEINDKILENPKFQLTLDDARNFLLTTTKKYDVIESDSIHPAIGISTHTKEYFEICKSRLTEQGIFSSWIPLYGMSEPNFKMMMKTLHEVFPNVMVWYIPYYESPYVMLMATKSRFSIDFELMQEEMSKPAIQESLAVVGLDDPITLLSTLVTDETRISDYVASALVNDDNHLYLPHLIPRQQGDFRETISTNIEALIAISAPILPYLTNFEEVQPDLPQILTERIAVREAVLRSAAYFHRDDYANAARELEKALQVLPGNKHIEYSLGAARFNLFYSNAKASLTLGKRAKALDWYTKAIQVSPTSAAAYNGAGMIFFGSGDFERALWAFEAAVGHCPDCAQPRYHLALVYEKKDRLEEAKEACRATLRINPYMQRARDLLERLEQ